MSTSYDAGLLHEEWDTLGQRIIDEAVAEWRKGLLACVAAGG